MAGGNVRKGLSVAFASTLLASPAAANGWDCQYERGVPGGAHYVTHFVKEGPDLVESHWPRSISYRILIDNEDILIAAHAYLERRAFARSAQGGAEVLILNKFTGRMRRSRGASGEENDQIEFGLCSRS